MKIIKDSSFSMFTPNVSNIADYLATDMKMLDCPFCDSKIMYDEAMVSHNSHEIIEALQERVEMYINDVQEAVIQAYGYDVQFANLVQKLEKLIKEYSRPKFDVIKGGKSR